MDTTRARVFALLLFLIGCGGSQPPAVEPQAAPVVAHPRPPAMKIRSELGSVDPDDVTKAFHALSGKFAECQKEGLSRVSVLEGRVKFFVRIGEDGLAKWAFLEETDVGDQATERCLVDAAMGGQWPKPDGGDAEARHTLEFPLQGARGASEWDASKVAHALASHGGALERCKSGDASRFRATMYVGPGGRVISAGVVSSTKDSGDKSDCLADALLKLKGLPSPGSWPAKVSFTL